MRRANEPSPSSTMTASSMAIPSYPTVDPFACGPRLQSWRPALPTLGKGAVARECLGEKRIKNRYGNRTSAHKNSIKNRTHNTIRPAAFARIDSGQSKPAFTARLNALFTFRSAEPNRIFIALGAMNSVLISFLAGAHHAHVAVHDASAPFCRARVRRVLRRTLHGREGTHDARGPRGARTEPPDRAGKAGRALNS